MNDTLNTRIIDALVDDGYIVVENALNKEIVSSLLALAQEENAFKTAGISSSQKLHIDSTRRRDKISWLDQSNPIAKMYLNFSKSLQLSLNRELYLGLSYYEAHFAIYEKGDFYEKHLDAFKGSKNRIVTTVFYLNDEWNKNDGGALCIYDKNDTLITEVLPKSGTLVVFMSEDFPHEVLKTDKKRYSIAGWFRIDR